MSLPDMREAPLRDKAAIVLGGLGLASGIASALIGLEREHEALQPLANVFGLHASLLPIGALFALAMAAGIGVLSRRVGASLVTFVATLYAWSGAIHIAIRLQRNEGDTAHLLAASLAAGAFGAGVSHLAAAFAIPRLRRWRALMLTMTTGALLGLLYFLGERGFVDRRALFIAWQAGVAFVIGLSAAPPPSAPR